MNILGLEDNIIATSRKLGDNENWYLYNKDIRTSTASIIGEDGSLAAAYDYDEFGNTDVRVGEDFYNEICYTGQVYDKVSGLYYYNARYYNAEIGRFITQDTYRGEKNDPGTYHLYVYCANDPINYVDPSGHAKLPTWVKTTLRMKVVSASIKTSIRSLVSSAGSVYLSKKGYTLAKALFNHALWGFGKTPGKKVKNLIISKLQKSKDFKKAVKKKMSSKKQQSIAFNSGDLYYGIQKMNYKITSKKKKSGTWNVKVKAWDYYNFDEIRKPLLTFSNAANNMGYTLEKLKISYPYNWSVSVTMKIK